MAMATATATAMATATATATGETFLATVSLNNNCIGNASLLI